MTDIKTHIKLLINKYDLSSLYNKYKIFTIINNLIKESLYWLILIFSFLLKKYADKIKMFTFVLISLFCLNIPFDRYTISIRDELIIKLEEANDVYYIHNLVLISKNDILKIDLVRYFNSLELLNDNIKKYIQNIQIRAELPFSFITLLVISLNKNLKTKNIFLVIIFAVFYFAMTFLNNRKIKKEIILNNKNVTSQDNIRNYIINSKNLIANNNFNQEYMINQYNLYNTSNKEILDINSSLSVQTNILVFATMLIPILNQFTNLNAYDFISYFLIFYDIELITTRLKDFYYNKSHYDTMNIHLDYLNQIFIHPQSNIQSNTQSNTQSNSQPKPQPNSDPTDINIRYLSNAKPFIKTTKPIIIKKNDHILIDGLSGSGKTSLLYFLKGIITLDSFEMTPDIASINQRCFLTLPNVKSLYSGLLYDIITNYEVNPNVEHILICMKLANLDAYIEKTQTQTQTNRFIEVDKISAGESSRFLIARIIYMITFQTKHDYSILLFDEIDSNLNDSMAIQLCQRLLHIFSNKTILYITHNIQIKKLFKKKITIDDGIIN